MTLKEIAEARVCHPKTTHGALKMARFRKETGFPEPVGQRGTAHLYVPAAVAEWDRERRS